VEDIQDCFVTVDGQTYAKTSVRRVRPPLGDGSKVQTTFGVVGTVQGYVAGARVLTIVSGGTSFEIDRCAICDVLTAPTKAKSPAGASKRATHTPETKQPG
jgi:preprotein translocase subunit YajC